MKTSYVLLAGVILFGTSYGISKIHGGTPPTKVHQAAMTPGSNLLLEKLREVTAAAPDDVAAWKTLANALSEELKRLEFDSPDLSLEMVDVLSNVLRLEPSDPQALITLANLAFNQRAFVKAAELYERYLARHSDDLLARASLGSSYTFLGRMDDAERELLAVVKSDPQQFQGLAYVSILYSEKGDQQKAVEFGQRALAVAPGEEAKARFGAFLEKLGHASSRTTAPAQSPQQVSQVTFDEYVKKHHILGPKLSAIKNGEKNKIVELNNFPIAAMPPIAKQKLERDLLALLPAGFSVKLIDLDNKAELVLGPSN